MEIKLKRPTVNKIAPLRGGTHFPIARRDKIFGRLAANIPAIKRGITCPIAKLARNIIPLRELPCRAIQARSTAKTGVVHGDDAKPNAKPADRGANAEGAFCFQISGSGPAGRGIFIIPRRFRPIINANRLIRIEKTLGNCP